MSDVLDKKLDGEPIITLTEESPQAIGYRLNMLDGKARSGQDIRPELSTLCAEMRTSFEPSADLNTVDQEIMRLAVLDEYVSYRSKPEVRHQECINDDTERKLSLLSPSQYRLIGDRPNEIVVRERITEFARTLERNDEAAIKNAFSSDGRVVIEAPFMLEAGYPSQRNMPQAAGLLVDIDFYGPEYCHEIPRPRDGSRSRTPIGFYKNIKIEGTIKAVAMVVDYHDDNQALVRDLFFTTPDMMYRRLDRDGSAANSVLVTNKNCISADDVPRFKELAGIDG
ncbi:hypothetical protein [Parvularcula lutaonensis]|uniref:Uncharacterized protein n=1 Tax=Parvularcula lutaonensis TaxID=491923 RepID=A0ABV7M9Z0_9PROT|nr:hypothetical protein [Parvularcula lutaonensis]GGY43776.1 hypothetical protein GCM10007148_10710 [Parvularcula lutaonensis]